MTADDLSSSAPTSVDIDARAKSAIAFRRKQAWLMTPEARMTLSNELSRQAFAMLEINPCARREFVRRNHHQRRISNVRRLEAIFRGCSVDGVKNQEPGANE